MAHVGAFWGYESYFKFRLKVLFGLRNTWSKIANIGQNKNVEELLNSKPIKKKMLADEISCFTESTGAFYYNLLISYDQNFYEVNSVFSN